MAYSRCVRSPTRPCASTKPTSSKVIRYACRIQFEGIGIVNCSVIRCDAGTRLLNQISFPANCKVRGSPKPRSGASPPLRVFVISQTNSRVFDWSRETRDSRDRECWIFRHGIERKNVEKTRQDGSPTCRDESIAGPIERNRHEESGSRKPAESNDRSASRR